ncbi:toxin-antitoxin system YwqK family antitoxin [bacterium SCSIO 12643]|nr:toxin-antitoxin system YwqK family antitoxin [bacterium SCSIO 12643]
MKNKLVFPFLKASFFLLAVLVSSQVFSQTNVTDKEGRKQGYWEKKRPSGKIHYKGQFKDNIPYGKFKYYDKEGTISSILEYITPDTVMATHYHSNGKKAAYGYYVNQQKEGIWRFYDRKGIIASQEAYSNGKKDGKYIVYNLNGSISRETYFVKGVENGYRKTYDSEGNLLTEGEIKDGQMDGMQIIYTNGKVSVKGAYKHAVKDGDWVYFDENGKQIKVEHYELGIKKD